MEDAGASVYTCITWVPRGVAAENPEIVDIIEPQPARADYGACAVSVNTSDLPPELRMDDYDCEEAGLNPSNLTPAEIELAEKGDNAIDSELVAKYDAEEDDDLRIDPATDHVLVMGFIEDEEECSAETLIYTPTDEAIASHHSILLTAFPMAVTWLPRFKHYRNRNFVAVASSMPVIQIYNNDVIDQLEPAGVLDSPRIHHAEAVTCLALNPVERQILLSGSHDNSAIVWDLCRLEPIKQYTGLQSGKLTGVAWSPDGRKFIAVGQEPFVDVVVAKTGDMLAVSVSEPVEAGVWVDDNKFVIVTREGSIIGYGIADVIEKVFERTVCDGALLSIIALPEKHLLILGAESGTGYIYSYTEGIKTPEEICSKNLSAEPVFDMQLSPDLDSVIGIASNTPIIWDLRYEPALVKFFGSSA